jgi:hypothetical protein
MCCNCMFEGGVRKVMTGLGGTGRTCVCVCVRVCVCMRVRVERARDLARDTMAAVVGADYVRSGCVY